MPYRESIRKSCKAQGRHKKQTGGHGQFGDVWIQFEPCEGDEIQFEEKVFGGSVPKNFFPAVEKGVRRQAAAHGVLAGYPMVGMKATLPRRQLPPGRLERDGLHHGGQARLQGSHPPKQAPCCLNPSAR